MTHPAGEQSFDQYLAAGTAEASDARSLGTVALLVRYGILALATVAFSFITKVPAPVWFVLAIACLVAVSRTLKHDPAAVVVLLVVISCAGTYRGVPAISIGAPISLVDVVLIFLGLRLAMGARSARRHDRGPFIALLIVMFYATLLGLILGNDKAMVFRHLHDALPFALIPLSVRVGGREDDCFRIEAAIIVAGVAAACLEMYLYVTMITDFSDFRNAGVYQFVIALAAAFLLHWQINRRSVRTLPGHAIAVACQLILAAGVFVSGTRNAMVLHAALLVIVVGASAIVRGRARFALAGLLVFCLSALLAANVLQDTSGDVGPAMQRFSTFSDPTRQDDTFALRIRTTKQALSDTLHASPILGLGFGRILQAYGSLSYGVGNNVEIAPGWWFWTTGLVGLIVWLYYSVATPLGMIGRARRIRDPDARLNGVIWTITCAAFIFVTSITALVTPEGGILTGAFLCVDWREVKRRSLGQMHYGGEHVLSGD